MSKDIGNRGCSGAIFRQGTMDFAAGWLLGYSQQGGMSAGALLAAFRCVRDGDPASWVATFEQAARAEETRALHATVAGRSDEAAEAWLSAYVGLRAALMLADPTTGQARLLTDDMVAAFRAHLTLAGTPLRPWLVPLGESTLPGYRSADLASADRVLFIVGGGDTYVEDLWYFGAKAALGRGWRVAMVDLPGQGATPYQGLHFGPRTLDGMLAALDSLRDDGFDGEVVAVGWSGGGIFVTKLAEVASPQHRLRAVIASTPVHDARALFTNAIPSVLRRPSRLGSAILRLARVNPVLRASLAKYDWQFGNLGIAGVLDSFGDLARTDLDRLDVPFLALVGLDEDGEALRQARAVIDAVSCRQPESELVTFPRSSGAGAHCQVGNLPLAMIRSLDWLDRIGAGPRTGTLVAAG